MVQFNAHFDGNVIKPDEPVELPIGTPLRVTIDTVAQSGQVARANALEQLKGFAKECEVDGPPDLAENHDHYAHGRPLP